MLTRDELQAILAVALIKGGDFAEIFIEDINTTSITCEDNKLEKIVSGTDGGAGLRVIARQETAYLASTDTSFSALKEAALKLAASLNRGSQTINVDLRPQPPRSPQVKQRPNQVSLDEKVAMVNLLNQTARSFGKKVKQVTAAYNDSNQGVTIANSAGLYVEDNRIRTRYYLNVITEKNGLLQTGYEAPGGAVGFELFDLYPPAKYAAKAAERALLMLEAPHAPAGQMMVVLSSEAGGTLIHEACGHALEADFILKGTSLFAGRIGQKVASDLVTVIDDGTVPGQFGTQTFDDEGTPAQKTLLIENGVLRGFLTDRYNARELKLPLSGNGRREDWRHQPIPRMTNTLIAPGKMDPAEIIASVKDGLLVKRMGGGQVNVTNGDFIFEVNEGYLIANGQIKHPVRGAVLTGNGPKVLASIDMVGTDLGWQTGVCGKFDHAPVGDAQPTIRIPELIIGGRL